MKIIIYATHSYGTYPELIKNKDVIVLGYGDKWEGFIKKAKTINRRQSLSIEKRVIHHKTLIINLKE
jgi:hypothetical protein